MFELLLFVFIFYIGFQVGIIYTMYKLRDAVIQGLQAAQAVKQNELKDQKLIIEHIGNLMYLYHSNDHSFICQGDTLDKLAKLALEYKNINHAIVFDTKNQNLITFRNGQVHEGKY